MFLFLLKGALGFAFGFLAIYGFWRIVAGRPLSWDVRTVWSYMGIAFPLCIAGEIFFGHLHFELFGQLLWQYQIRPIHGGYTSLYNFAIWPLYGWHLYLCKETLSSARLSTASRNIVHAINHAASGPLLEVVANLGMLLVAGSYYFYYFPNDLWHLTSIQVIPYYTAGSLMLAWVLTYAKHIRWKVTAGTIGYLVGVTLICAG